MCAHGKHFILTNLKSFVISSSSSLLCLMPTKSDKAWLRKLHAHQANNFSSNNSKPFISLWFTRLFSQWSLKQQWFPNTPLILEDDLTLKLAFQGIIPLPLRENGLDISDLEQYRCNPDDSCHKYLVFTCFFSFTRFFKKACHLRWGALEMKKYQLAPKK